MAFVGFEPAVQSIVTPYHLRGFKPRPRIEEQTLSNQRSRFFAVGKDSLHACSAEAGDRRTSTVRIVSATFRDPETGPPGEFIVSRNLPEPAEPPEAKPSRKQVAVLFADIVESTELIARLGDEDWVTLLTSYYGLVRRELSKFHGWYLSAAGDGFLAGFDQCNHAIRFSVAIRAGASALGLRVRIGVHAGECVALGSFLAGLTLHVGARIAAAAKAGEMLVSDCVRAHISDPEIQFVDRGIQHLRGVPGEWRLFVNCQA
jgi:class 3 adenylate cyclase